MDWQGKVKQIMVARGVTQEELAEAIGVSVAAVSRYLSGKRGNYNLKIIMDMANFLEVHWLVLVAETPLDERIFGHLGSLSDTQKEHLLSFLSAASQLFKDSA